MGPFSLLLQNGKKSYHFIYSLFAEQSASLRAYYLDPTKLH